MPISKPPKPSEGVPPERASSQSNSATTGRVRSGGRIVHDERGNAVWKLGGDTARSDSTSRVLRALDTPELELEGQKAPMYPRSKEPAATGTQTGTKQHGAARGTRAPIVDAGGGYNPYDLTEPVKKRPAAKKPPHGRPR